MLIDAFRTWWLVLYRAQFAQMPPELSSAFDKLKYSAGEKSKFYADYLRARAQTPYGSFTR
jgi:hypothetical protein